MLADIQSLQSSSSLNAVSGNTGIHHYHKSNGHLHQASQVYRMLSNQFKILYKSLKENFLVYSVYSSYNVFFNLCYCVRNLFKKCKKNFDVFNFLR